MSIFVKNMSENMFSCRDICLFYQTVKVLSLQSFTRNVETCLFFHKISKCMPSRARANIVFCATQFQLGHKQNCSVGEGE